jgi:hypothetical protein
VRRSAAPVFSTAAPFPSASPPAIQPPTHRGPSFTIEKAFTLLGVTVAALLIMLFSVDLVIAFPFQRASLACDVGFLVSGTLLFYLSIDVLSDQRRIGLW